MLGPLDWLKMGIAPIPVTYRSKKPEVLWRQYQYVLPPEILVRTWFRPRQVNMAVVCGWEGLTVLDFDELAQYHTWRFWTLGRGGLTARIAAETFKVQSSRGMHVYLFCDEKPKTEHFNGGDIRGQGGYVLVPPSIHPSGHQYASIDDAAPIMRIRSLSDILPDPPKPKIKLPAPLPSNGLGLTLIEQIKEALPIESLFPDARPSGGGRWMMARCPWHDDKDPSFRIDLRYQVGYCFTCGDKAMDSIAVYAKIHGLDNKQAVKELARRYVG